MLQTRCAKQQVHSLQAENQSLQLHLEETQRHCRQLEDTSRTHRQVGVLIVYGQRSTPPFTAVNMSSPVHTERSTAQRLGGKFIFYFYLFIFIYNYKSSVW